MEEIWEAVCLLEWHKTINATQTAESWNRCIAERCDGWNWGTEFQSFQLRELLVHLYTQNNLGIFQCHFRQILEMVVKWKRLLCCVLVHYWDCTANELFMLTIGEGRWKNSKEKKEWKTKDGWYKSDDKYANKTA